MIIPDLRGHGRSEKTLSGHTLPQYAADLQALFGLFSVRGPCWWAGRWARRWRGILRADGPGSVAGLVIVDQSPCDFAWEGSELGGMTPEGLRQGLSDCKRTRPRPLPSSARRCCPTKTSRPWHGW